MSELPASSLGSFRFCPSCGAGGEASGRADGRAGGPVFLEGKRWLCRHCGFEYFHNVAAAAGVILDCRGDIVFVERAKEPRRGKLGLPGGFVDPGERAEDAAQRECREEIGGRRPSSPSSAAFPIPMNTAASRTVPATCTSTIDFLKARPRLASR